MMTTRHLDLLLQAVVKVGDGRGFIVETAEQRVVITAAHCLPALSPADPGAFTAERTYGVVLGPLGKAKPTVWAECLFADPLADVAVLGSPDDQEFGEAIGVVSTGSQNPVLLEALPPRMGI